MHITFQSTVYLLLKKKINDFNLQHLDMWLIHSNKQELTSRLNFVYPNSCKHFKPPWKEVNKAHLIYQLILSFINTLRIYWFKSFILLEKSTWRRYDTNHFGTTQRVKTVQEFINEPKTLRYTNKFCIRYTVTQNYKSFFSQPQLPLQFILLK